MNTLPLKISECHCLYLCNAFQMALQILISFSFAQTHIVSMFICQTNFRCCHLKLITVLLFLNLGSFWHHSSTMIGVYEHWRLFWKAVAVVFISWRKVKQSKKVRLTIPNFWLFRILYRYRSLQLSSSLEFWEAVAWIWRQFRKEKKHLCKSSFIRTSQKTVVIF